MENSKESGSNNLSARMRKLEEQNYELERQIRAKDQINKKDRAVYEQKIQLLELQINEAKERYF